MSRLAAVADNLNDDNAVAVYDKNHYDVTANAANIESPQCTIRQWGPYFGYGVADRQPRWRQAFDAESDAAVAAAAHMGRLA